MNIDHPSPVNNLILIVDDTPANLKVLSETIEIGGYAVAVALTGEQALRQCQHNPPDLILLDVQMPGIDGFETCLRLKQDPATKDIPVIFMTALFEPEHKIKGFNVGAVDYITKPFRQEEVLARVKIHLQIHHLSRQLEMKNLLLTQINDSLEERVIQRTSALQQVQLQLVQQEKLSALGQLVAGVAHEINNPVSFIYGNVSHAQQYVRELIEVLDAYQAQCPNIPDSLQDRIEAVDLPFLKQDLIKLLDSMGNGANRIREIVLSLRNFSRLDEAVWKAVDIHEGIENTLLILQHRLKANPQRAAIHIAKNYGQMPLVDCFPGQLNQVFMNLLANAIDALDESDQKRQPEARNAQPSAIAIHTEVLNSNWVRIRVQDNGLGIPDSVKWKLFDPFFTTKPIGKGTGLGLFISHQIVVERHGGKLFCQSPADGGAEFTIEIPIRQAFKAINANTGGQTTGRQTTGETTGEQMMQEASV
jgi:two-component system, NtrC family, sensor kinase